jgi:hypothetical protein
MAATRHLPARYTFLPRKPGHSLIYAKMKRPTCPRARLSVSLSRRASLMPFAGLLPVPLRAPWARAMMRATSSGWSALFEIGGPRLGAACLRHLADAGQPFAPLSLARTVRDRPRQQPGHPDERRDR